MAALNATQRTLRTRWKLGTAIVLILLAALAAYAAWVYAAARDVERLLDEAEALDIAAIATGDEDALAASTALVKVSGDSTTDLSGKLGPVRVAAVSFGWLPWIGDQLRAPNQLTERAEADLSAARLLISATDELFAIQSFVNGGHLVNNADSTELEQLIGSLERRAAESDAVMARVNDRASRMEDLSLLGIFKSRADRLTSLEDRLLDFGGMLNASPRVVSSSRNVGMATADLLREFNAVNDKETLDDFLVKIKSLALESSAASNALSDFAGPVERNLAGSQFAELIVASQDAMDAVASFSKGLVVIIQNLNSALNILRESEGPLLSNGDELVRALRLLASDRDALQAATEQTAAAAKSLNHLAASGEADFLPQELRQELIEQTGDLVEIGELLSDGPKLLLSIIGADPSKKYLVLGQTSDELRAAGGFTSSVWTIEFLKGSLANTEYIPVLEFDDSRVAAQVPPPPEPLATYMDAKALYIRDVGWDPDFQSVGRLASELHTLNQKENVDGVIAVTQWGIIRLIQATGGIEVDGELVAPEDTLRLIEERTDREGTEFLQKLFIGLLDALSGDKPAGMQLEFALALGESVLKKDIMLFSNDEHEQGLIELMGVGGRFPTGASDRLAIVDSNVGWSKSDRSIERVVEYQVNLHTDRPVESLLTLRYRNLGSEEGRDCGEQSPPSTPYDAYSTSTNSCYWDYLRAYVGFGAELKSAPLLPLPPNSVPDQKGTRQPGTPTFSAEFDEYGDHFSGLIAIPPGGESEIEIRYSLPASTVKQAGPGVEYRLRLFAQPGARGRNVTVEVTMPDGHALLSSSHAPASAAGGKLVFELDLQTDAVLVVQTDAGPASS